MQYLSAVHGPFFQPLRRASYCATYTVGAHVQLARQQTIGARVKRGEGKRVRSKGVRQNLWCDVALLRSARRGSVRHGRGVSAARGAPGPAVWTFPANSAPWMNGSWSLHGLLKAPGAYLPHIRMWGCNYGCQVKDGKLRGAQHRFVFFPLPPHLCQHGTAGLPVFRHCDLCTVITRKDFIVVLQFSNI